MSASSPERGTRAGVTRGDTEPMTTDAHTPLTHRLDNYDGGDAHVLIRVWRNLETGQIEETLMGNPASWGNCQQRWQTHDDSRIASGYSQHQLHYKVRSADDPAVAHLVRFYVSQIAAAQAMSRRAGVSRWRLADALGVRCAGWHAFSRELRKVGYIGTVRDGRAYLTAAGQQAADAIANPKGL
jgi:hypothetical protein